MNNLAPLMSSARTGDVNKDEWRTPLWLFETLHKEFHFVLDAAATNETALCDFYFDIESDGLGSDWHDNVFVNPPYSQLKKWVKKGYEESKANKKVGTVVMLIPARTDTQAWWQYIRFGEVRFLPGRLKFKLSAADKEIVRLKNMERIIAGKPLLDPENSSAPFPSAIVVFRKGLRGEPETQYWNIRESTHASSI